MKVVFSKFLLFTLVLSFCQSENLLDEYKRKIGNGDVSVHNTTKATVNTYAMADEINRINTLKKKTFESSKEFSARVNTEIRSRDKEIVFYVNNASKNYSVGTLKMKRYNPDSEIMTLNLLWNKQIEELLPQSRDFRTVSFNISREEAKKIFEKSSKHYFHIKLKDKNNKLLISKILFTDKYLLYADVNTLLSRSKSDYVKKSAQKQETVKCKKYYVTADKLNVRERASKRAQIIGSVNKNDTVCVYASHNKWLKIENGWVSKDFLKVKNTSSNTPLPEPIDGKNVSTNYSINNSNSDSSSSFGWWWILIALFFLFASSRK